MKLRILSTTRLTFPLASAIAVLLSAPSVHAGQTWDGGGADSNWLTVNNWDANVLAAFNSSNALTFVGNTRNSTTNNVTADTIIGGINFTNDGSANKTNAFTLATNRITLGGNITTTANTAGSTITDIISLDMILNADRTITTNQQSASVQHNLTVSGIISETGTRGLIKAGGGVLNLTGANSYTGTTTINAGTLNLGNSTANGSLLSTTLTLGGGAFSYTRTGNTTQSFTTTNINAGGAGQISVVSGNILNLGTVTRAVGVTLDFSTTGAGTVAALAANNDATGIMRGFTVGNSWAVANGAGVAISGLAGASYTLSSVAGTTASSYLNGNIDVDNSAGTLGGVITANSLRFSAAAANTMTLATGTNTISSGGILVGSAVGSNLSTITGGTLTGLANQDLSIIQNNTSGGLTISSTIANTTSTSVTKSGAGLLTLAGNNTFTGGLTINTGRVALNNVGALFSTAGSENAVTFGSGSTGTLSMNGTSLIIRSLNSNATTAGTAIVENANATPATLTIGNSGNVASTFAGTVRDGTGGGALSLIKAGTNTLTLSGTISYTGTTVINAGTVSLTSVTMDSNIGTGAITVNTTGNLLLNNGAGGATFTRPVTLNGGALRFTGSGSNITYSGALNVAANSTIDITGNNSGVSTITGNTSGAGGLTVINSPSATILGILRLNGASNNYAGPTVVTVGGLTVKSSIYGNDTTKWTAANITVGNGTTNGTLMLNVGGAGEFTTAQAGTMFTQLATSITNNGLRAGSTIGLDTRNAAANSIITYSTVIDNSTGTGAGAVNFKHTGGDGTTILALTGANTYTGQTIVDNNSTLSVSSFNSVNGGVPLLASSSLGAPTTVANGTIHLGSASSLSSLGNTFKGGSLTYTGTTGETTDRVLSLNGGGGESYRLDQSGSGLLKFTSNFVSGDNRGAKTINLLGSTTGTGEISGLIFNSVSGTVVTKAGTGTWTLSAANAYTGGTSINGGTLRLSGAFNMPTTGTLAANAGGTFSLADGTARNTTAATVTLATGATLSFDWNAGAVDNLAPTVAVTPAAAASVGIIINATNTPTGSGLPLLTGITGSTLNNPNYFLANNTNFTATLTKPGAGAGSLTIGGYSTATALTDAYWKGGLTNAVGAMAFSTGTASNWYSSAADGPANGVVPGGSAVNVIFGATTGSNQSAVTTGADMNLGSITFNDSTAVTIAGSNAITLNSTSSTAAATSAARATITNTGTGVSAISVTSFANATNTISSKLVLGENQTWNVASGKTLTVSGAISGNKSLTKADAGTLTLTGANIYSGATNVTAGTLKLNGGGTNTTISTDGNTTTTSDIVINGGTLEIALSEQIANTGSINMSSGALNFGAATGKTETIDKFTNSGGVFSTGANTLIGLGNTITWSGGTNTVNNGGSVQDAHIVISGGTNTVEGGATGGVLQLNSGGDGLEMSNGANLTLNSNATVAGKLLLKGNVSSSGATTVTIDSGGVAANKGNINLDGGTRSFTVANGAAATDMAIGAVITNGSLTKAGAGTLALSGANTYSGNTTVSAGTLLINGNSSTATGAVAVNAGTLGGTGTTGGAVTVAALATLAPGASIESLAAASLIMQSTSIFAYEVADNSSTGADLMALGSSVSLTGVTLSLDAASLAALGGGGWSVNDKLTLISYLDGGLGITSGFTGYVDDTSYFFGANEWLFDYNDTVAGGNYASDATAAFQNRFVTMTLVPEPRAALLGGFGLLMLLRRRRA